MQILPISDTVSQKPNASQSKQTRETDSQNFPSSTVMNLTFDPMNSRTRSLIAHLSKLK